MRLRNLPATVLMFYSPAQKLSCRTIIRAGMSIALRTASGRIMPNWSCSVAPLSDAISVPRLQPVWMPRRSAIARNSKRTTPRATGSPADLSIPGRRPRGSPVCSTEPWSHPCDRMRLPTGPRRHRRLRNCLPAMCPWMRRMIRCGRWALRPTRPVRSM